MFTNVHNLHFGLNSEELLIAADEIFDSIPVFAVLEAPQTMHVLSSLQFVSVQLRHVQKVPLVLNIRTIQTCNNIREKLARGIQEHTAVVRSEP